MRPRRANSTSPTGLPRFAAVLVEASGARWFILSAYHGSRAPDEVIGPYEYTLNRLPGIDERRAWADKVLSRPLPELAGFERVVMFAGQRYRELLVEPLRHHGVSVEVPMEGLLLGEQLAWLSLGAMSRLEDLRRFYGLLDELESHLGGKRQLASLGEFRGWPQRGVYFFFEPGEVRQDLGTGPRAAASGHARFGCWRAVDDQAAAARPASGNERRWRQSSRVNLQAPGRPGIAGEGRLALLSLWALKAIRPKSLALGVERVALGPSRGSRGAGGLRVYRLAIVPLARDRGRTGAREHAQVRRTQRYRLVEQPWTRSTGRTVDSWLGLLLNRRRVQRSGLWNQHHVEEGHEPGFLAALRT